MVPPMSGTFETPDVIKMIEELGTESLQLCDVTFGRIFHAPGWLWPTPHPRQSPPFRPRRSWLTFLRPALPRRRRWPTAAGPSYLTTCPAFFSPLSLRRGEVATFWWTV